MTTIKELREQRGWSQSELAYRAGTTQRTVSRLENGYSVTKVVVVALCSVLGVDQKDITGVTIARSPSTRYSEV